MWLKQGLGEAEAVRAATESYRKESDVLAEFIAARCVTGELHSELAGDLYKAHERWCEENGEEPFRNTLFGKMLTERDFKGQPSRRDGKVVKIRMGVCLTEHASQNGGCNRFGGVTSYNRFFW